MKTLDFYLILDFYFTTFSKPGNPKKFTILSLQVYDQINRVNLFLEKRQVCQAYMCVENLVKHLCVIFEFTWFSLYHYRRKSDFLGLPNRKSIQTWLTMEPS